MTNYKLILYSNVPNEGVSVSIYKEFIQINKEKIETTREKVAKQRYMQFMKDIKMAKKQVSTLNSLVSRKKEANLNNFIIY